MSFVSASSRMPASIGALAVLLAGCAGAGSSRPGGAEDVPAIRAGYASPFTFAPGPPVLQTLDVPLSQFPKAVGTALTGIRSNLITGFMVNKNGSNLGVVY